MPASLRCHLLIGPPASGKTTLAAVLADLTGALVLSSDVLLHLEIQEAVAAGRPVIVNATHACRPRRLAITQSLSFPAAVEWNRNRARLVPVIREMAAAPVPPDFIRGGLQRYPIENSCCSTCCSQATRRIRTPTPLRSTCCAGPWRAMWIYATGCLVLEGESVSRHRSNWWRNTGSGCSERALSTASSHRPAGCSRSSDVSSM